MSRIILKLSGEALAGPKSMGFDENTVRGVAKQVRQLIDAGYEVGVVTGGGNFWRGRTGNEIDRVSHELHLCIGDIQDRGNEDSGDDAFCRRRVHGAVFQG